MKTVWTIGVLTAWFGVFAVPADAAAIWVSGTAGFASIGAINDLSGACAAGCDTGLLAFTANLVDGMVVTGFFEQLIKEDGAGDTTAAFLKVTGVTATNTNGGGGNLSDTFYFGSDQFDPSLAGSAGVGLIGAYTGGGGNISYASTQAQMNYLTTGLLTGAAIGAPIAGFTLTTPATFVTCNGCAPIAFWEANFNPAVPGGVEQLVGAINFTLGPGASALLPGSVIVENDDASVITSELTEPATIALAGSALLFLALRRRLFRCRSNVIIDTPTSCPSVA